MARQNGTRLRRAQRWRAPASTGRGAEVDGQAQGDIAHGGEGEGETSMTKAEPFRAGADRSWLKVGAARRKGNLVGVQIG